eukprot:COSAG02_NODE_3373_length_6852_cov_3.840071_3_plen_81_part_00
MLIQLTAALCAFPLPCGDSSAGRDRLDVEEHGRAEEKGPEIPPEEDQEGACVLVAGPGRPCRAGRGAAARVPAPLKQVLY